MSRFGQGLERLSKGTVIGSAFAALGVGTWLGALAWAPLLWWSLGAGIGSFLIGRRWGGRAFSPTMALAYILPAVMLLTHGFMDQAYWNIWMAALFGGSLAQMQSLTWAFPARWKWPLAYWALAVALVWPAIVAREADFSRALMIEQHIGNSGLGGSPPVISVWVLLVALLHMLGLLWLDAACAAYPTASAPESRRRYRREMVWPLVISLLLGALVAIYQGAVDITWLSGHQYAVYRRATAALDDGNAFGAVAGMWIGGLLALIASTTSRWARALAVIGIGIAGAGLWATGSRMALLAAMVCVAFAVWFVVTRRKHPLRDLLIVGAPTVVLIAGFAVFASRSGTANPVDRVFRALPGINRAEIQQFVGFELWNRYGPYGTVSMNMVRDYPLSGVGIGSFNHIFTDESFVLIRDRAHMDNAQSWYRNQLAELGVLGSVGWLIWLPMFVIMLARTDGDHEQRFAASMIKGGLVGMGLVSIVSMPTQAFSVAFTVWVFIYWYLLHSSEAVAASARPWPAVPSSRWPVLMWAGAMVFLLASVYVGIRYLRPPFRALRADWTYQLGFSPDTTATLPTGQEVAGRWVGKHALETLPTDGRWLVLTVSGGPPDLSQHPQRLEVRRRGRIIISVDRLQAAPQTWYIKVPDGAARLMLEFDVNRTWRPSDSGGSDDRELGVFVHAWSFVKEPPRNSVVID